MESLRPVPQQIKKREQELMELIGKMRAVKRVCSHRLCDWWRKEEQDAARALSCEMCSVAQVLSQGINRVGKSGEEREREQVEHREELIYQPKMGGRQQLLQEKQPNYVGFLQGLWVTVMQFLSGKDFNRLVTVILQTSIWGHVNMPNLTAEMNMFVYSLTQKQFWSL